MKQKFNFSECVFIFLAIITVLFIVTMIWLYRTMGSCPDTLITCFFGTVVGQVLCTTINYVMKRKCEGARPSYEEEGE